MSLHLGIDDVHVLDERCDQVKPWVKCFLLDRADVGDYPTLPAGTILTVAA